MTVRTAISQSVSGPAEFVRIEAAALLSLAERLEGTMHPAFLQAAKLLEDCSERHARVVVTGMGKSGLIAQKIAATLSSTGTPSVFLHPAEALHGDLGILTHGDVVIALSTSGETEEILRLVSVLKRLQNQMISFCGDTESSLAQASDVALDCSITEEACPLGLAPTASTTVMLALGDALAMEVSRRKGFRAEDFAALHPGGGLGRRLARVRDLMHKGDAVPRVELKTPMRDVIYEMSRKGLGVTTVQENGQLRGLISDGDLRRLLEHEGGHALEKSAGDVMNPTPSTIAADAFAAAALAVLEERKITSLVVVGKDGTVEGVLHLHALWGTELI
jgi:arabinose-5-phosphate isomerase